ncbi:TPA: hypothetical protein ACH3X3_011312 [Trebouxia sp. C0006]
MQPHVVQYNRSIAALEHAVARPELSLPLLQLPDNVLELLAIKLPATTMVHLSSCCSYLQKLLHGDRLWQRQLEAFQPFWVSAGVTPKVGRLQGQSWHELVTTAYKLQTLKCSTIDDGACLPATAAWRELWKAGNMVHLDFHLCESEYRSHLLATRTGASFELRLNNIKDLLDAVYFFWYQERDLARGAKFLAKAVASLAKMHSGSHGLQHWWMNSNLTAVASSAAAFLTDILRMCGARTDPLSILTPHQFVALCKGSAVRPTLMSTIQTELEWYGNTYTWSDLEEALAVLVAPSFKPSDLTGRAYTSVHKPAAWKGLNDDCVALLRALSGAHSHMQDADREAAQDATRDLWGRAEAISQAAPVVSAYDASQAHQQFAGAEALSRLRRRFGGPRIELGRHSLMCLKAGQPQRCVHLRKIYTLEARNRALIAEGMYYTSRSYHSEWLQTGSADTFERAFSWRKCALRELLAKMHWAPDLYKMCHECLHSFCGMLRHCSSMQHASKVESVDASVLVLGGCALIMHKTGSYPALLRWLQKYIKGIRQAAEAFHVFLKSNCSAHRSCALKDARSSVVLSLRAAMNESERVETFCLPNGTISTGDLTHEQAIVLRLLGQVLVRLHVTAGRSILEAVATLPVPPSV